MRMSSRPQCLRASVVSPAVSYASEIRFAFVEEGPRALAHVLRRKARREEFGLAGEALADRLRAAAEDGLDRELHREGAARHHAAGERLARAEKLLARHHAV